MALVSHLLRRQIGRQPLKTLLAVAGIALGVATVVAIFTLDTNTVQARVEEKARHYARVDFQVLAPVDLEDVETRLGSVPGVANLAKVVFARVQIERPDGKGPPIDAEFIGLSKGAAETFVAYELAEGEPWPEGTDVAGGPHPVLLGTAVAEVLGEGRHAVLEAHRPVAQRVTRTRCNDGIETQIVEPASPQEAPPERFSVRSLGVLERTRLGLRHGGKVVLAPYESVLTILETNAVQNVYWVHRASGADLQDLMQRVRASLPGAVVDPRTSAVVGEDPDERAFRNGVRVCGVLALMLGLFVIFHTLSMSLVERMRQIGLMSALGTTRGQLVRLFLMEAIVYAALGALLGIALGLGLARWMLSEGITTLGVQRYGVFRFEVAWSEVLAIAAIGFLVALCGTIYPLWRSRHWTPSKLLVTRDIQPRGGLFGGIDLFFAGVMLVVVPLLYFFVVRVVGKDAEKVLILFLGGIGLFAIFMVFLHAIPYVLRTLVQAALAPFSRLWPVEAHLTRRNMNGSVGRVTATLSGIALVGAALIALRGMTGGLEQEVRDFAKEALDDKLFCSVTPKEPGNPESERALLRNPLERERVREFVAGDPDLLGFEPSEHVGSGPLQAPFTIRPLDANALGFGPLALDEALRRRFADATHPGVLISERLHALQPSLMRDGKVSLPTRTKEGSVEAQVLGVTNAYGHFQDERVYAVVPEEFFRAYHCVNTAYLQRFVLRLREGADEEAVARRLRAALAPAHHVSIETGSSKRREQLEDIARDFVLFDIILLLVGALAGLGLVNSLWIGALERIREVSVLKAIGMTPGQVSRMVLVEAFVTGTLGGVLGAILGLPFLLLILEGLAMISGLAIPIVIPWSWFAGSVAICAGIGFLAGWIPAWRVSRFQPVAVLRYE